MFYVYIMASARSGTIYTGSTDDLAARVTQHKAKHFSGFTAKYGVNQLVWFEVIRPATKRFCASAGSRSGGAFGSFS